MLKSPPPKKLIIIKKNISKNEYYFLSCSMFYIMPQFLLFATFQLWCLSYTAVKLSMLYGALPLVKWSDETLVSVAATELSHMHGYQGWWCCRHDTHLHIWSSMCHGGQVLWITHSLWPAVYQYFCPECPLHKYDMSKSCQKYPQE